MRKPKRVAPRRQPGKPGWIRFFRTNLTAIVVGLSIALLLQRDTSSPTNNGDVGRSNVGGLPVDLSLYSDAWDSDPDEDLQGVSDPLFEESIHEPVRILPTPGYTFFAKKPKKPAAVTLETEESEECELPRKLKPCQLSQRERIHVAIVSAQWNRDPQLKRFTTSLLKSILHSTRCRLHLHLLVASSSPSHPEPSFLRHALSQAGALETVPVPPPFAPDENGLRNLPEAKRGGYLNGSLNARTDVLFSLHEIPVQWVEDRAKALNLFPLAHASGVPGMAKFFLPEILWQVKRTLCLDADTLLGSDVQDLWARFEEVDSDKRLLFLMGNNHPEGGGKRRSLRPFSSAQMAMDLGRMRKANLTKLFIKSLNGQDHPKDLRDYIEDGDQFLFTWICTKSNQTICRVLPRLWNVSGCTKPDPFLGLNSRSKLLNGSCWHLLHLNCLGYLDGATRQGPHVRVPSSFESATNWTEGLRMEEARGGSQRKPS